MFIVFIAVTYEAFRLVFLFAFLLKVPILISVFIPPSPNILQRSEQHGPDHVWFLSAKRMVEKEAIIFFFLESAHIIRLSPNLDNLVNALKTYYNGGSVFPIPLRSLSEWEFIPHFRYNLK